LPFSFALFNFYYLKTIFFALLLLFDLPLTLKMKKLLNIVFMFLLYLFFVQPKAIAQTSVIKTNLASVFSRNYGLQYELAVSSKISVGLGGNYIVTSNNEDGFADSTFFNVTQKETGFAVFPEVRYYLTSNYEAAPRGLFVGANYFYEKRQLTQTATVDTFSTSGNVNVMRAGILIGNQWVLGKHFAAELFVNPMYVSSKLNGAILTRNPLRYEAPSGIKLRLGVMIGFAF
jgi:hypothetical protein